MGTPGKNTGDQKQNQKPKQPLPYRPSELMPRSRTESAPEFVSDPLWLSTSGPPSLIEARSREINRGNPANAWVLHQRSMSAQGGMDYDPFDVESSQNNLDYTTRPSPTPSHHARGVSEQSNLFTGADQFQQGLNQMSSMTQAFQNSNLGHHGYQQIPSGNGGPSAYQQLPTGNGDGDVFTGNSRGSSSEAFPDFQYTHAWPAYQYEQQAQAEHAQQQYEEHLAANFPPPSDLPPPANADIYGQNLAVSGELPPASQAQQSALVPASSGARPQRCIPVVQKVDTSQAVLIHLTGFGWNATINEIISVLGGSNAKCIEYPAGNDGIHFEIDWETGKAGDCFIEMRDEQQAKISINKLQAKEISGRRPKATITDTATMMSKLFPRAYGVAWGPHGVHYIDFNEFDRFFDKENFDFAAERVRMLGQDTNKWSSAAPQRPFEHVISLVLKFPWTHPAAQEDAGHLRSFAMYMASTLAEHLRDIKAQNLTNTLHARSALNQAVLFRLCGIINASEGFCLPDKKQMSDLISTV
ncbi:hypothetical protein K490DRAFT_69857 [Saccharata proteae CBS 121410]|uniref:RRM domain-containing protein n=1 Tax=Saccharata proteae CBS 121410 TaxID=1314787 RepID=A0A9P4HMN8_9PEZI|nr:hypothetical protein K490DRAFT_69857 [Saccharata proteae CBS 121410]